MRPVQITLKLCCVLALLLLPARADAGALDFMDGIAVGAGINRATENDADEEFVLSLKAREDSWEYGFDLCTSGARGGEGEDNFLFLWGAWIEEFQRSERQDYGIYVGAGAGMFAFQEDLIDWPAGPFVVLGWDFSAQSGLEGKVGYFGENYWGTALFYWYFE